MKFYVVDDDPHMLRLMAGLLETRGHTVMMSHAGASAIIDMEDDKPDCLITDVAMVGMDGISLIGDVRGVAAFDSIKIVVVSASTDEETKARASAMGADAYIEKPIDPASFIEVVEQTASDRGV